MRILSRRSPFVLALLVALPLALALGACQSAVTSTGPSPTKCQIVLGPPGPFGAAGGPGVVTVSAAPECPWTASTTASWISSLAPATGQGGAEIQFQVSPNPTGIARQADIMFSGLAARVSQAAPACTFTVSPTSHSVSAAGGTRTVTVTTLAGCDWTSATATSWLRVVSGATGSGSGTVTIAVEASDGSARTGAVTIAGQAVSLTQQAITAPPGGTPEAPAPSPDTACTYRIDPGSYAAVAGVDTTLVAVSTSAQCGWGSLSQSAWLTVVGASAGTGNGTVTVRAAANTGAARTGTVIVAEQTFTVTQAAAAAPAPTPTPNPNPTPAPSPIPPPSPNPPPCTSTINPTTGAVGAGAGAGPAISVSTQAGCAWTAVASASASWITVTSGASGSGNGTVGYSVGPNIGPARTGTIAIAGQTHTVTQATGCAVSILPSIFAAPVAGGAGTPIAVTAGSGCTWTASTTASSWITINTGSSGTGNGTVTYTVAANTGAQRIGTINVGGQTFTVSQATGCTYSINPTSKSFNRQAGTDSVSVTAPAGCAWTAVSNNTSWLTVSTGATGSGPGTVTYSVAANGTGSDRDGTLTIAGRTFDVHQNK